MNGGCIGGNSKKLSRNLQFISKKRAQWNHAFNYAQIRVPAGAQNNPGSAETLSFDPCHPPGIGRTALKQNHLDPEKPHLTSQNKALTAGHPAQNAAPAADSRQCPSDGKCLFINKTSCESK